MNTTTIRVLDEVIYDLDLAKLPKKKNPRGVHAQTMIVQFFTTGIVFRKRNSTGNAHGFVPAGEPACRRWEECLNIRLTFESTWRASPKLFICFDNNAKFACAFEVLEAALWSVGLDDSSHVFSIIFVGFPIVVSEGQVWDIFNLDIEF